MSHISRMRAARRQPQRHEAGQALIELALSFTFLAFLFAGAVDLGIAYKSYQTLINASAEASSYLMLNPVVNCQQQFCPNDDASTENEIEGADREARNRFRIEQGVSIHGTASTLDLDANAKDDLTTDGYGWNWINSRVRIDEADSSQVTIVNDTFAIDNSFDPSATNADCKLRRKYYTSGTTSGLQCFIVVRSQIDYHPFAIAPVLGDTMTIRAISVLPITQSTQ
jgi:hypothetical protein